MSTQGSGTERTADFHLKEYESLRQEIASTVEEGRRLERYALAVTSGVWVWLLTKQNLPLPVITWWIPFLFTCLCGMRAYSQLRNISLMADYIRTIEETFCTSNGAQGWQTYLLHREKDAPDEFRFRRSAVVYWVTLSVVTAIAPLFFVTV